VPVYSDNTSRLAALAEATWGAGRGNSDVIFVKLAAGVGSGLVFGGSIFRGSVGAAGEIGHITVDENGPACRCGNRGCLETYAGVPAVLAALRPVLGEQVTLGHVLEASTAGDRACRRVIADAGRVVGTALAGVCNLLNPEKIIIGGDLAAAADVLFNPLRASLRRHALGMTFDAAQITAAELGDHAGALGGVALVLHEGEPLPASSAELLPALLPAQQAGMPSR
jgi:predicted NBD/HSP70 family sugar kinase